MHSWNTIRTICAVLLLIPIVHLVYMVSQETLATLNPLPEAWEDEVAAYQELDQSSRLPDDPVVVIGGRRVKLWHGLNDLLTPRPVLMRGLGDATVTDIIHYHAQLIGFYRPRVVVLLPGNSEFHIRDNKSAPELASEIRKLAELDGSYHTSRQFYVISPIKTPLYQEDNAKIDEVTELLELWARTQRQVRILDANALLSLKDGSANPDYFRGDGVNLNEHGYLRVSLLLQAQLEQDDTELYALDGAR